MNHDKAKNSSLKIATRSSPLALIQANYVKKRLQTQGISSELCLIKTTGDKILDKPLHEIGGKGVFIKELEKSLLRQETHIAVHSLKDLACTLEPSFKFVSYLPRTYFHDILVVPKESQKLLAHFPEKKVLGQSDFKVLQSYIIGTGSLRRKALIAETNPELKIAPIRGNINTRLEKLKSGTYDALILSEASLERLGISEEEFVWFKLEPSWFVPCTAQGVIAVESLAEFSDPKDVFAQMNCSQTQLCCELERGVMARLGGSCLLPIGIYFQRSDGKLLGNIVVLNENATKKLRYQKSFSDSRELSSIIEEVIRDLLDLGVNDILQDLGIEKVK